MKNKVLVNINIPEIDQEFDMYIPLNKKISTILILVDKNWNVMNRHSPTYVPWDMEEEILDLLK